MSRPKYPKATEFMSPSVKEWVELSNERRISESLQQQLCNTDRDLSIKMEKLIPEIIRENKLLEELPWVVQSNQTIQLYGQTIDNRPKLTSLFQQMGSGFSHDEFYLNDDVSLHLIDSDFYIRFEVVSKDNIAKAIKRWNLEIDTSEIDQAIKKLNEQIKSLTEILSLVKP